jgi:hypothetical protein
MLGNKGFYSGGSRDGNWGMITTGAQRIERRAPTRVFSVSPRSAPWQVPEVRLAWS